MEASTARLPTPPSLSRGPGALARFGLFITVVVTAAGVGIAGAGIGEAFTTGGVAGAVAVVLVAAAPTIARLRTDLLDGPGIYALVTAIELGLVSLAWLGNPPGRGPGLEPSDIATALLLVAMSIALFGVGARVLGPAQPRTPLRFDVENSPSRGVLIGAFAIGLLGAAVSAAANSFGYVAASVTGGGTFGQVFSFLQSLSGIIVLITALVAFNSDDRSLKRLLAVFVALTFGVGFISGVKTSTLEPFVFVGLAWIASGGRIPWRATIAVVLFAFVVVIPAVTTYRASVRERQQTASQALSQVFSNRKHTSVSQIADDAYRYTIGRFRHIDSIALIVRDTPSNYPYAGGRLYVDLPSIIVVPRALWPSKPRLDLGVKFSRTYWQVPAEITTSTPLTHPGDLYRSFGLIGVIIGMTLWGMAIGGWQRLYRGRRSARWEVVFLYSLLYGVATIEPDLPEVLATAAKSLPLVALIGWLLLPGRNNELPGYRRLLPTR